MELCDSDSSAKKSHPQNVMGDLHPFEFEPLSLSLSAPLSLLWQKSHFFGLFWPWVGLRGPKTNLGAMGHRTWYKTSKWPLLKVTRGARGGPGTSQKSSDFGYFGLWRGPRPWYWYILVLLLCSFMSLLMFSFVLVCFVLLVFFCRKKGMPKHGTFRCW